MKKRLITNMLVYTFLNVGSFALAQENQTDGPFHEGKRFPLFDLHPNTGRLSPPDREESVEYLETDTIDDNEVERIKDVLSSYNSSIGSCVEQQLINVFSDVCEDMIYFYLECALRIYSPELKVVSQLELATIISHLKILDARDSKTVSRVFCFALTAIHGVDNSPAELLASMAIRQVEMSDKEFFERMEYLEKITAYCTYLDYQFIRNTMKGEITQVRELVGRILSSRTAAGS
mgnify:CR=1 FL=1